MKKSLILILLCFALLLCGCKSKVKITGTDTKVTSKFQNMIELEKSVFLGQVKSISTKDAVITKYNVDISKYTVYTVEVLESIDGYTPKKEILLYHVGTKAEYPSRLNIEKNEKYIFDADLWVYGDSIVYLLSPFSVSYPKVDSSESVTIATSETEALAVCTYAQYKEQFEDAKADVLKQYPDFFDTDSVLKRYVDIFEVISQKNLNKGFYKDGGFDFVPSDIFIDTTKNTSNDYLEKIKACKTTEELKEILK